MDPVFPFVVEDFFCIALNIQEECVFGLFLLNHMLGKENFAGGYKMFEAPMTNDQFLTTMFEKDVWTMFDKIFEAPMTDQCMFGNRGDGLFAQETHCIAQYHKNVDKMRRHLFGTSFKSLKTRFTAIVVNQTRLFSPIYGGGQISEAISR